jgi:lysozyme
VVDFEKAMKLGVKGETLIKSYEKCRLVAYPDQKGVPTIGWGHTGPEVHLGMTCTQAQADAWFEQDVQKAVLQVIKSLDIAVNQNQFDALVAFTYNVGVTAEGHSTLIKLVNAGYTGAASAEFGKWNHVDGEVSAGLTARRAAEKALFLS